MAYDRRTDKGDEERLAHVKLRKQAKEKRHFNRLLARAEKLEKRAKYLMNEAKVARARHAVMAKKREVRMHFT